MDDFDMKKVWLFPKNGVVPDISWALGAQNFNDLLAPSMAADVAADTAREIEEDKTQAELRATTEHLKRHGIDLDVDRMLRGSFIDNLLMKWDDLVDGVKDKFSSDGDDAEETAFVMQTTIAITHTTDTIPCDYDDFDDEVLRLWNAVGQKITEGRGVPPQHLSIPDWDEQELEEDAYAVGMTLERLENLTYWQPVGDKPGLALAIHDLYELELKEIQLFAHGTNGHRQLVEYMQRNKLSFV